MKNYFTNKLLLIPALFLTACSADISMVNLGIDDEYYIYRMQKLNLESAYTGEKYQWTVKTDSGTDSIISTERSCLFLATEEKTYNLTFQIFDPATPYKHDFTISAMHEEVEYSPYISKVIDFNPAPGQFINIMPEYEVGDTKESMRKKVEENISGTNDVMISLGAYGGYVTFTFDHTVINVPGKNDLYIMGNSFFSDLQLDKPGGSAEPGIVMVAYDSNCNGVPDDNEWYELAGSEYYKPTTVHNYSITYQRPQADKMPVPDMMHQLTDAEYIPWTDNQGDSGYVAKNSFHTQDYYPKWISEDNISFDGTLLPKNATDISGYGTYYVLYCFDWGYVDNYPNNYKDKNSFDIGWAVDRLGNKVYLPGVDFVRVYTGVNQYCGWIGETSTEICRAQDLHIAIDTPEDPVP